MKRLLSLLLMVPFLVWVSFENASALLWIPYSGGPDAPEVSIVGDSIIMGIHNDTEDGYQAESLHGASALLSVGPEYLVTFEYSLSTWDSYNTTYSLQPNGVPTVGHGWWDSFLVSTSGSEYWNLTLTDPLDSSDPLDIGFLWGGTSWGDGNLETLSGNTTISLASFGNSTYLNVYLDTATNPHSSHHYPSWGTITVIDVKVIPEPGSLFLLGSGILGLMGHGFISRFLS
jgi:hypothetical protein